MSAPSVNPRLTPKPRTGTGAGRRARHRQNVAENDDYAAFTHRIITAHGRRIAQGDIDGLTALAEITTSLDAALSAAVRGLRATGYSWADIATRLGITRQAAQQRWGGEPS